MEYVRCLGLHLACEYVLRVRKLVLVEGVVLDCCSDTGVRLSGYPLDVIVRWVYRGLQPYGSLCTLDE